MSTYTFACRQLFNVFGVRSIPNTTNASAGATFAGRGQHE